MDSKTHKIGAIKYSENPNYLTAGMLVPCISQVLEYVAEVMPPETPLAFGLHPNAEIGFKLREAEAFCVNVSLLQPREAGGDGGMSMEEKSKMVLDDLVERLPDNFDMEDIRGRVDEYTPYVMVAIQVRSKEQITQFDPITQLNFT